MNFKQVCEQLADITSLATITMPTTTLLVGREDGIAGELLLWLVDRMPNATQGDIEEVLAAATWWLTYTGTIAAAEKALAERDV